MTRTKSAKALLVALLSLAIVIAFMPAMAQSSYAASKLKVSPSKKTISVKKTVKLTAKGLSAKQLKKVKWSTTKAGKKIVKLSASKGKTIKVTGKKAGKAKITAKYGKKKATVTITVKKASTPAPATTDVASVAIDKTSPKVGDTLVANTTPAGATATYKWFADGAEISGATSATYVLTKDQLGKKISVEATGVDKYKGTVKSAETAAVAEATITAALSETGSPTVGTAIKVNLTPAAAESAVSFQWYRGKGTTNAINGATSASYTPVAADAGSVLTVKMTVKTGEGYATKITGADANGCLTTAAVYYAASADAVQVVMSGTPEVGKDFSANIVRKDTTTTTQGYTAQWYVDSVKDDNKLGAAQTITDTKFTAKTTAANDTATVTLSGSQIKAAHVGKTLILVVKQNQTTGEFTGTSVPVATSLGTLSVTADTDANRTATSSASATLDIYFGSTTLTASFGKTAKDTATYQWYKTVNSVDQAIEGATAATYAPAAADSAVTTYKVVATGTGSYTGTKTVVVKVHKLTEVSITAVDIYNGDKKLDDGTKVASGTTVKAVTTPALAKDAVDYKWTSGGTTVGTTDSYTLTDTDAGQDVVVTITLKDSMKNAYTMGSDTTATVKGVKALTAVTAIYANGNDTTAKTYATSDAPVVGQYIKPAVTPETAVNYKFFLDDESAPITGVATATNGYYQIPATLLDNKTGDHKIIVKAIGASGLYQGAEVTMTTPVVKKATENIAGVKVVGTTDLSDGKTAATVGDKLKATAWNNAKIDGGFAIASSNVTYTWKVGDTTIAANSTALSDNGASYTIQDADAGKTISVTAAPKADATDVTGTATWDMGKLSIQAAAFGIKVTPTASGNWLAGSTIVVTPNTGYAATYTWTLNGVRQDVTTGSFQIPADATGDIVVTAKNSAKATETATLTFNFVEKSGDTAAHWTLSSN